MSSFTLTLTVNLLLHSHILCTFCTVLVKTSQSLLHIQVVPKKCKIWFYCTEYNFTANKIQTL